MAADGPAWEDAIRSLRDSVEALEARVRLLEGGAAPAHTGPDPRAEADLDEPAEAFLAGVAKAPAYVGRLLLVMGGAYLLRALTGGEQVAGIVGAAAGLTYGLAWLFMAARAGRGGDEYAAGWHGVASAAILFPLLWETSARFDIISYPVAAVLLTATTLTAFWIATRRALPVLAVLFAAAAGACGLALMISDGAAAVPASTALFLLGLVGLLLGRRHGLSTAMGVAAGAADAAAIALVLGAVRGSGAAPWAAIVLLAGLCAAYLLAIAADALAGRRLLDRFDWAQSGLVLLLGFGGAMFVARRTDTYETILGVGSVVLAVGLYLLAFTVLDRERRRCFQYLTTIAIVLVLAASASLLLRPVLPWAVLAVATALTARRFGRVTLGTHAGIYALAATLASGVLAELPGWWMDLSGELASRPAIWLAAGALVVVGAVRVLGTREANARTGDATRAVILVVLVAVGGGLALRASSLLVAGAAWQAAVRTLALAALTLTAAGIGRRTGYRTLGRLVPVLLGVGALKLLFEDLVMGRPVTLALSFSVFGLALILSPRLLRRRSRST